MRKTLNNNFCIRNNRISSLQLICFAALIIFSCVSAKAQNIPEFQKLREIKLLEMKRDEVRKILADYKTKIDPADDNYPTDDFESENAEIEVSYSEGNCEDDENYNVPQWTVQTIKIYFKTNIKIKDSGVDLSKYRKERWYIDNKNIYAYYDKEKGILFGIDKAENEIDRFFLMPEPKYYGLMCDKEKAKILASTKSVFSEKLEDRNAIPICTMANVTKVELSKKQVFTNCNLSNSKSCSTDKNLIKVSTTAVDPENDVLIYDYTISAGKIIGKGAKVVWDLSGVKPGTYTITASVDDGCGFCGSNMTKTVTVKECPNCREN